VRIIYLFSGCGGRVVHTLCSCQSRTLICMNVRRCTSETADLVHFCLVWCILFAYTIFSCKSRMSFSLRNSRASIGLLLPKTIRRTFSYKPANVDVKPALSLLSRKKVFVSSCYDIFSNLALEDWFYENVDFSDGLSDFMFLWRNKPCIVIGRHQNVWAECWVSGALASGIAVARRRSGGGTVYHDTGNLNATFFTSRKNYNRKANLEMIAEVLRLHCKDKVEVSKRDDVILNDTYKVSLQKEYAIGTLTIHAHVSQSVQIVQTWDTLSPVPNCLQETSALVPKCPGTSATIYEK